MMISIMQFPPIKDGKDEEFRQWFNWSAEQFNHHEGLISRRLFKPEDGGNYVAVVEMDSKKTFEDMHRSPTQAIVRDRLLPLLDGKPSNEILELVEGS